ncbi:MAG: DUF2807 domain-containing protein [Bacteroidales bacterium]
MKKLTLLMAVMIISLSLFGQTVKKDFKVSGYDGIDAGGIFTIELIKGSEEGVVIETENTDIIDYIKVYVNGKTLYLTLDTSKIPDKFKEKKMKSIKATINIKDLSSLNISGAAKLTSNSTFTTEKFDARISGAASVNSLIINAKSSRIVVSGASVLNLSGKVETASYEVSGAAKAILDQQIGGLKLSGSGAVKIVFSGAFEFAEISLSGAVNTHLKGEGAKKLLLEMTGASLFNAAEFPVNEMDVKLAGVSNATLNVTSSLSAEATGGSSISYKGNPQIKSVDISSISSLKKIN